jgi:hypothetical protein
MSQADAFSVPIATPCGAAQLTLPVSRHSARSWLLHALAGAQLPPHVLRAVGVTYSSEGALGVGHGSLSSLATRGRLTNR